jgi:hypothetical protein
MAVSHSSTGVLFLDVLLIVVAMVVLDRFEAWRLRVRHPRSAPRDKPASRARRKAA